MNIKIVAIFLPSIMVMPTWAAELIVANNGVDSSACGSSIDPCRTINRAINNASDNDTVIVGPGLYTETLELAGKSDYRMIVIQKPLTVISRDGAGATILRGESPDERVVWIESNDVTFGGPNQGFTLTNSNTERGGYGLFIYQGAWTGITVQDNVATGNGAGFHSSSSGSVTFLKNVAHGNNNGFWCGEESSGNQYIANFATRNYDSTGYGIGFGVAGNQNSFRANLASDNLYGFDIHGTNHEFINNAVVGNSTGFEVRGSGHVIKSDIIVGNKEVGINVPDADNATLVITKNNIYGNDVYCGIKNDDATNPVLAPNNYWGAATGPGDDPADKVCGLVTVKNFAVTEFDIPVRAGR